MKCQNFLLQIFSYVLVYIFDSNGYRFIIFRCSNNLISRDHNPIRARIVTQLRIVISLISIAMKLLESTTGIMEKSFVFSE